jgi:hypothetical protein
MSIERGTRRRDRPGGFAMTDLFYAGLPALFLGLCLLYAFACERLR